VIVVKAGTDGTDLRCGGHPMASLDAGPVAGNAVRAPFDEPTLLGKRYVDETGQLELLCTKAGDGSLSIGDELLRLKDAKPLPASD
jgi:hypothetical protein